jgi:hypothetical protein
MPVLVAAFVACGDGATEPADGVPLDVDFTLQLGETAAIEGTDVSVTLGHVLDDSRCPPMAVCIWAGNVTVVLEVSGDGTLGEIVQVCSNLDICDDSWRVGSSYRVHLVSVQPGSRPPTALEYSVTLRVRPERNQ